MFRSRLIATSLTAAATLFFAVGVQAQTRPLSAIEWLDAQPVAVQPPRPAPAEPPIAASGTPPTVTVAPLLNGPQRRYGVLPKRITGLSPDIWVGSNTGALEIRLGAIGTPDLPAAQELLLILLLAEADAPGSTREAQLWLLDRIDRLADLGAVEPALALILQAKPRQNRDIFDRWLALSLLSDGENTPCAILVANPALSSNIEARIYCLAQQGDFDTAALVFGTSAAVDLLNPRSEALLARFLDPDLHEEAALPAPPARPDPLTFRLYEAAGRPIALSTLPRRFAQAGLRSQAGWKQQLASAERLTRAGVYPPDQLVALYAARKPAASGGIWERAKAVQNLQQALQAGDPGQVSEILPEFWHLARDARLAEPLSRFFSKSLAGLVLDGDAAKIAFFIQMLGRDPAAAQLPADHPELAFLHSVATGVVDPALARDETQTAIAKGLTMPAPDPGPAERGARLLDLTELLEDGANGDPIALRDALAGLRAAGQRDLATRAALQVLTLRGFQ